MPSRVIVHQNISFLALFVRIFDFFHSEGVCVPWTHFWLLNIFNVLQNAFIMEPDNMIPGQAGAV